MDQIKSLRRSLNYYNILFNINYYNILFSINIRRTRDIFILLDLHFLFQAFVKIRLMISFATSL